MARSRHRRARDLEMVRVAAGTAAAALAGAAALLVALADDPKLLRTGVVLALAGLALLGAVVASGSSRESRQLADATTELAAATAELVALRRGLLQLVAAGSPNGSESPLAVPAPAAGSSTQVDKGTVVNVG